MKATKKKRNKREECERMTAGRKAIHMKTLSVLVLVIRHFRISSSTKLGINS